MDALRSPVFLFLTTTLLFANTPAHGNLQCKWRSFYPRLEFDNTVFSMNVVMELDSVDYLVECFRHWLTSSGNTVLYNQGTRRCRMYSATDNETGRPEPGWQYYGASCETYSLNNSGSNSDVLSDNKDDVCDADYHAHNTCPPTSCFRQGTWMSFNFACTSTLFMVDPANVTSSASTVFSLPFDLQPGHVISLQLKGNEIESQSINLDKEDGSVAFHLALRLSASPKHAVYNTVQGGWGVEEFIFNIQISDISSFAIDIHILDTEFKTYLDGELMMTNQMRMTFTGVKVIRLVNCLTFYKLKVGYHRC